MAHFKMTAFKMTVINTAVFNDIKSGYKNG